MRKLSQRQNPPQKPNKNDPAAIERYIKEMKETLKHDPVIIDKFKEAKVPLDEIDTVAVSFCPLDVSAKTKACKIYLNEAMLDPDSDIEDPTEYMVHEITHWICQYTGASVHQDKAEDYMDDPGEVAAFKAQTAYKERTQGEESAERYVKDLTQYHGLSGRDKKEKEQELLGEAD
jgi:imidazoleglycerol phosphate dehydratase HisB